MFPQSGFAQKLRLSKTAHIGDWIFGRLDFCAPSRENFAVHTEYQHAAAFRFSLSAACAAPSGARVGSAAQTRGGRQIEQAVDLPGTELF